MRELLSMLINPVPVLYFLLLAGLLLSLCKYRRSGSFFLVAALLWFFLITTPFLPVFLVSSLESRYGQLSDKEISGIRIPCDIVVLGGGHTDDDRLSPNNQLSPQALARLVEGIRIHRKIPGSRLITSGYKGASRVAQADLLYHTAIILGVDPASLDTQTRPANTRMEAEEYVRKFGKMNNVIIVTSASHMPRAMMHFRNAGTAPVAAPTHFIIKKGSRRYSFRLMPSGETIMMMQLAIHEYAGRLWAKIGGR